MHYLIKELAPPILNTLRWYSFKYGWKGNYKTFTAAKENCTGYDADSILKRIAYTTDKVRTGAAVYERDGILYDEIKINFNLLSVLLMVAGRNDNELTIIDFGGSLGTTYYQNIKYLSHLKKINWCIIEQENFAALGKKSFENEHVKFYNSLEECHIHHPKPDLILISSVLQYIQEPYALLEHILSFRIPNLMLDLVGYTDGDKDRITIQHVPPVFYGVSVSYPCTFFNRMNLESKFKKTYCKIFDFISEPEKYYLEFKPFHYEGAFWELQEPQEKC